MDNLAHIQVMHEYDFSIMIQMPLKSALNVKWQPYSVHHDDWRLFAAKSLSEPKF